MTNKTYTNVIYGELPDPKNKKNPEQTILYTIDDTEVAEAHVERLNIYAESQSSTAQFDTVLVERNMTEEDSDVLISKYISDNEPDGLDVVDEEEEVVADEDDDEATTDTDE